MESKSSGIPSQEKGLRFEDLEKKVKAYLSNPESDDPYSDVNRYFGGISDPKEVVDETLKILFDTRSRCLHPQPSDFDSKDGNVGTMAMRLPYFHPLHITLFSWYVEASIKTAQELNDEGKKELIKKIGEDVVIYCLPPDEVKRVKNRLSSLSHFPKDNKSDILPPEKPSQPWYRKLKPFKRK